MNNLQVFRTFFTRHPDAPCVYGEDSGRWMLNNDRALWFRMPVWVSRLVFRYWAWRLKVPLQDLDFPTKSKGVE
jgi:hypothetical protein